MQFQTLTSLDIMGVAWTTFVLHMASACSINTKYHSLDFQLQLCQCTRKASVVLKLTSVDPKSQQNLQKKVRLFVPVNSLFP